ncbi:MAG: feruloyl-CoA synthase [Pseudomonadota bacterium]
MTVSANIPFREVPYLPQKLSVERRGDAVYLSNGQPLKSYPGHMLEPLKYWAEHAPGRVWIAQRDPVDPAKDGWEELSYGEAWARVRALAQGFLNAGAGPDAPVMILSRNTIDHAIVMYAAMLASSPVVPVTPAYALLSQDFARLNYVDQLIEPKYIYVEDGHEYQRGLDGLQVGKRLVLYSRNAPQGYESQQIDDFAQAGGNSVADAYDALRPQTVAKYMLTSGSTGEPKAVINTHEMIAANAKMIRSVWNEDRLAEVSGDVQVMCNFLPWSHTYGANAILHNLLDWGGTLYIDWGAPTPARLPEMIRNMREVAITQHTTVPAAWAALATEFERDEALAKTFFSKVISMAYGGAAMGQDIYERIQTVAVRETGKRISLSAGYGATETAPTASNVHWPNDTMGLIGLPLPGNTFKLVPNGEKQELRVKGVNVTPGYYRNEAKTAEAFDQEGYYRLGDAVRFVDPNDPDKGLAFDGRTAEEFKLANGTWVSAGKLRVQIVEAVDGALSDVVVCGLNEDDIRLLGFLNETYCQRLAGESLPLEKLTKHPDIINAVQRGIDRHNQLHPNASARVAAIRLLETPPQADAGEITEKGYINQNKVQTLRCDDVNLIYNTTQASDIFFV